MTDQSVNRYRAARIVRAQLDDDTEKARAVLDEAFADGRENGLAGIISALTTSTIELLLAATGGDLDAARRTVDLSIMDNSMGDVRGA